MAASVRIEDEAFGDGRYEHLGQLLGTSKFDAIGRMSFLWRQCTQENTHVLPESFVRVFVDPEKLCESRLGERVETGIRIRGTRGRIEWLSKLRKNGRKGGRPRKPNGYPNGNQERTRIEPESNPPAPAPAPAPIKKEEENATPAAGAFVLVQDQAKPRSKTKASDPTPEERASALVVLSKLSAQNDVQYTGSDNHVRLIARQLRNGITETDLRAVIGYCALELGWKGNPKMHNHLCPETLFGPEKIFKYLDPARTWFSKLGGDQ